MVLAAYLRSPSVLALTAGSVCVVTVATMVTVAIARAGVPGTFLRATTDDLVTPRSAVAER